jgi:hypothetical protein
MDDLHNFGGDLFAPIVIVLYCIDWLSHVG